LNGGVGVNGHEHQAGNDAVADDPGGAALRRGRVDEETRRVALAIVRLLVTSATIRVLTSVA
jgi:hypothetical protein